MLPSVFLQWLRCNIQQPLHCYSRVTAMQDVKGRSSQIVSGTSSNHVAPLAN